MKRRGILEMLGLAAAAPLLPPGVERTDHRVEAANVVVLRHDGTLTHDEAASMALGLRKRLTEGGAAPAAIIVIDGQMSLEVLDEAGMRRYGWRRA